MQADRGDLDNALSTATARLLAARTADGYWEGQLSSSATSTATAVGALAMADPREHRAIVRRGLDWLACNANDDGGWGDTTLSESNLSATLLAWSAFGVAGEHCREHRQAVADAERWLGHAAGGLQPQRLAEAVLKRYGADRTFSTPILTMCAISGRLGSGRDAWRLVRRLPFELAILPHGLLRWLRLPVVSYAMPALIAIGCAAHHHNPPRNPLTRLVRLIARPAALRKLAELQPPGGGFLEAAPLTAFVVMSLLACGQRDHPAVARGVGFLTRWARDNGSWPIDTNLATWLTTLSVNALAAARTVEEALSRPDRQRIVRWLLAQQCCQGPRSAQIQGGGWAWTHLPGGVADADDTAGAMLALRRLAGDDEAVRDAAARGAKWLLGLQNRDGGIPTFCRGWGALPFDRSAPDLTAHAVAAWVAWLDELPRLLRPPVRAAVTRAADYLARTQRRDGAWVPLWFGGERAPREENPTYGTARVLSALAPVPPGLLDSSEMSAAAAKWLLAAQNADGGWGGVGGAPASIEETAVAVDALAAVSESIDGVRSAVARGAAWLIDRTEGGDSTPAAPIGLYFARLWYFEKLYPLIFTVSALARARSALGR